MLRVWAVWCLPRDGVTSPRGAHLPSRELDLLSAEDTRQPHMVLSPENCSLNSPESDQVRATMQNKGRSHAPDGQCGLSPWGGRRPGYALWYSACSGSPASGEHSVPRGLVLIPLQLRGPVPTKAVETGLAWPLAICSFLINDEAVPMGAGGTKPHDSDSRAGVASPDIN